MEIESTQLCVVPTACGYVPGEIIHQNWHWGTICISIGIALCGSFVSLTAAEYLVFVNSKKWYFILVCGAGLAIGFNTVWCMHFVGMGAVSLQGGLDSGATIEVHKEYEVAFTILTGLAAWLVASICLHIVAGRPVEQRRKCDRELYLRLIVAGSFLAVGVIAAHNMGVISCTGHFYTEYDPALFASSCIIALVASIVGLFLLMVLPDSIKTRMLSAAVIAFAVSGMHYVGMLSCTYRVADHVVSYYNSPTTAVIDNRYVGMMALVLDLVVYATCIQYGDSIRAEQQSKEDAARRQKVLSAVHSVTELGHPYIVLPAVNFLDLTLESFSAMHEGHRNQLVYFDTLYDVEQAKEEGAVFIFFSYECLRFGIVGPDAEQLRCMKAALHELCNSSQTSIDHIYIWLDCISVPQKNKAMTKAAVDAIYTFASLPTLMIIIAPTSWHTGKGIESNTETLKRRLWCRVEHLAFGCRRGVSNMKLHRGHRLEHLPSDWMESICVVFDSDSTCCRMKHTMSPVCDRETVVQPLLALYYEQHLPFALAESTPDEARQLARHLLDKYEERMFPTTFLYETVEGPVQRPLFGNMLSLTRKMATRKLHRPQEMSATGSHGTSKSSNSHSHDLVIDIPDMPDLEEGAVDDWDSFRVASASAAANQAAMAVINAACGIGGGQDQLFDSEPPRPVPRNEKIEDSGRSKTEATTLNDDEDDDGASYFNVDEEAGQRTLLCQPCRDASSPLNTDVILGLGKDDVLLADAIEDEDSQSMASI